MGVVMLRSCQWDSFTLFACVPEKFRITDAICNRKISKTGTWNMSPTTMSASTYPCQSIIYVYIPGAGQYEVAILQQDKEPAKEDIKQHRNFMLSHLYTHQKGPSKKEANQSTTIVRRTTAATTAGEGKANQSTTIGIRKKRIDNLKGRKDHDHPREAGLWRCIYLFFSFLNIFIDFSYNFIFVDMFK